MIQSTLSCHLVQEDDRKMQEMNPRNTRSSPTNETIKASMWFSIKWWPLGVYPNLMPLVLEQVSNKLKVRFDTRFKTKTKKCLFPTLRFHSQVKCSNVQTSVNGVGWNLKNFELIWFFGTAVNLSSCLQNRSIMKKEMILYNALPS